MLRRLGQLAVRRRKTTLAGSVVFFVLAGVFGGPIADSLIPSGSDDPSSESVWVSGTIEEMFGTDDPNLILLVTAAAVLISVVRDLGHRLQRARAIGEARSGSSPRPSAVPPRTVAAMNEPALDDDGLTLGFVEGAHALAPEPEGAPMTSSPHERKPKLDTGDLAVSGAVETVGSFADLAGT